MPYTVSRYIVIYVINPVDDTYVEFQGSTEFGSFGISKEGDDFFGSTQKAADFAVAEEDRALFKKRHTKENILKEIEKDGAFVSRHHLLINGNSVLIVLRCVRITENGEDRLIMGMRKV